MPNPLELEVTIRIVVDLQYYPGWTHEAICEFVKDNRRDEIEDVDWQSVSVRVAPTEPEKEKE